MGPHLRDKRDVAVRAGIDPIDDKVSGARHPHKIRDPLDDERGVRAARKRARAGFTKLVTLAAAEADRSAFRSSQNKAHTGTLGELFSQTRKALLESVGVQRFLRVKNIKESVRTGRDHPDAVLLVCLWVLATKKVFVDVVEILLEESCRSLPARADAVRQPGLVRRGCGASARVGWFSNSSKIQRSKRRPSVMSR